jgi:hypothetical protein
MIIFQPWNKWWWKYIFEKSPYRYNDVPRWTVWWCRMRGHPAGPVWYNPRGLEPDMTCKNCGDDIG